MDANPKEPSRTTIDRDREESTPVKNLAVGGDRRQIWAELPELGSTGHRSA